MALIATSFLDLPEPCLALTFAYLAESSLAHSAESCTQITPVARADRLWLPLAARRWRFGTLAASSTLLTPGARDAASANAVAASLAVPLNRETDVFGFFHRRCSQDAAVASLMLQLDAVRKHGRVPGAAGHADLIGAVVQIGGLEKAPQYNGCCGVVTAVANSSSSLLSGSGEQRCVVTLLSLPFFRTLSVSQCRLTVLSSALSAAEAQKQMLDIGVEAVDVLLRLSLVKSESRNTALEMLGLVKEEWAVQQWNLLLQDQGRTDLLEEGGLILSQWADPGIDVSSVRAQLASLADTASSLTAPGASLKDRIDVVNRVLDEYGLTGNVTNYYDPNNSFLHAVLRERKGIPISLSIIWAALARRLAIPCFLCVNMPRHVLIRVTTGNNSVEQDWYVDAFRHVSFDFQGLVSFVQSIGIPGFDPEFVAERPATAVYARLLRNVQEIYRKALERNTGARGVSPLQDYIGICSQSIAVADPADQPRIRFEREKARNGRDSKWR